MGDHDPALVERVAQALAAAEWPTAQWTRIPVTAHDTYRRMARAAVDAIIGAGVMVDREQLAYLKNDALKEFHKRDSANTFAEGLWLGRFRAFEQIELLAAAYAAEAVPSE